MDTVIIPRQRHLANVIRDIIMCDQCGILARVRQIDHGWHWSRCWSLCLLRIGYLKCLTPLSILGPSPPGPITPSVGNDLTNQKPHLRHRKHGEQKFGWSMHFFLFFRHDLFGFFLHNVKCISYGRSNVLWHAWHDFRLFQVDFVFTAFLIVWFMEIEKPLCCGRPFSSLDLSNQTWSVFSHFTLSFISLVWYILKFFSLHQKGPHLPSEK